MNRSEIIKKLESIEANAHRLIDVTATLKEELSGGSDSSNSSVLSLKHQHNIIAGRKKHLYKK